jgi:hypothetical protein
MASSTATAATTAGAGGSPSDVAAAVSTYDVLLATLLTSLLELYTLQPKRGVEAHLASFHRNLGRALALPDNEAATVIARTITGIPPPAPLSQWEETGH